MSLKIFFSNPRHRSNKVYNDDQGRVYQNCKFDYRYNSEYVFSSLYFTLIAILLKDYDAAFLYNCWFLFIIIMGMLICKYAPLWQEYSVKSLILRWPLRPVGLLFNIVNGFFQFPRTKNTFVCICNFDNIKMFQMK